MKSDKMLLSLSCDLHKTLALGVNVYILEKIYKRESVLIQFGHLRTWLELVCLMGKGFENWT